LGAGRWCALGGGRGSGRGLLTHGRYLTFTHESGSRASSARVRTPTPVAPFG
jgi:hypothetical protein